MIITLTGEHLKTLGDIRKLVESKGDILYVDFISDIDYHIDINKLDDFDIISEDIKYRWRDFNKGEIIRISSELVSVYDIGLLLTINKGVEKEKMRYHHRELYIEVKGLELYWDNLYLHKAEEDCFKINQIKTNGLTDTFTPAGCFRKVIGEFANEVRKIYNMPEDWAKRVY